MSEGTGVPCKTRDLHNHHMDSTVWDEFKFRDDDVIVATYGKAGTTWTQQMVAQLLLGPDPEIKTGDLSPWLDLRVIPREVKLPLLEAQSHRRFIKTHLPVDALTFSPLAKYLYIARDGRDVMWSMYNHHANFKAMAYDTFNNAPGLIGPPLDPPPADICVYFRDWLERDGFPFWSFWENIRSWWEIRDLPNVMLLHFAELKVDMPGNMRRIANFLDVEVKAEDWPQLELFCTFDWMKANSDKTAPAGGIFWEGGSDTFINKGTNGRWQEILPTEVSKAYEVRAIAELGEECAAWLAQR
jgi:aryl sulfotransferase